jgi:hypothetical protein
MYYAHLGFVDITSIEDFSSGNNSAIFQRASALASTYFLTQGDSSSSSGLSTGAIAGIVISIIVVVLLLLVAIVVVIGLAVRSRRSKKLVKISNKIPGRYYSLVPRPLLRIRFHFSAYSVENVGVAWGPRLRMLYYTIVICFFFP